MKYKNELFSRIKLVIWDLDDTFWMGTISEGAIVLPEKNVELLKVLTEIGIVNSICSKNDNKETEDKLKELEVQKYFVFSSINWKSKGPRIKDMLRNMNLREENTLFIDDNHLNIAEAEFYCPNIMTAGPEDIESLYDTAKSLYSSGIRKNRIQQYRILENKFAEKTGYSSNEEFLIACNIHIDMIENCENFLNRIDELNIRANQLNFTKNRVKTEKLEQAIHNPNYRCGMVCVSDKYGDYGISGFYCLDVPANKLVHFFFSCRIMGMGVEQYVYQSLGRPTIKVIGEVSSKLDQNSFPYWINKEINEKESRISVSNQKILIKGPCDLWSVCNFFRDDSIDKEFTYTIEKNNAIDFGLNHTVTILDTYSIDGKERKSLQERLPFIGERTYSSKIFSSDYSVIILSLITDAMLACYRNKTSGRIVTWGDWCLDITNPVNWEAIINGEVETYGVTFDLDFLICFSKEWEYLGQMPIEMTLANVKAIRSLIPYKTKLVLLLGSEIAYELNPLKAYDKRELYNQELNSKIKELFEGKNNTFIINTTDFITSQKDFTDRITHFTKSVYYRIACQINEILQTDNITIHQRSRLYAIFAGLRQKMWRCSFVQSIYKVMTRAF